MKAFFNKYKRTLGATVAILILYAVLFALGITCPIKYVSGISCPGCGMSRACFSALRFDLSAALAYHPLCVLLLPFAITVAVLCAKKKRSALRACVAVGVILMLTVYVWRMIDPSDTVVVFEPQNSLVGRIIGNFFE
jgi:hypothetical protein